jgi:hypothetical protein
MKNVFSFHVPVAGNVDHGSSTIRNVSIITGDLVASGHDLYVDSVTLDGILLSAKKAGKLPVKLDHGSGVKDLCGFIDNFRRAGNKIIGDWHLLETHAETPKMLERAERMPECFGLSVAFAGGKEAIGQGRFAARCDELKAVDCVTDPAAQVNGLFSTGHRFDNRPRTAQGMFAPQGAGGADPNSMHRAYNGQAAIKRSQVDKIMTALRLKKPIVPSVTNDPMLSSRSHTINFMAKWKDGAKVSAGDRVSPKLAGVYAKATREGLFTKNGQPIKGQDHIRGALNTHFQKNPHGKLEGELYVHGTPFEDIVSASRTSNAKLQFHIHPGQNAPAESQHIKHIPESQITNEGDLEAAHDAAVKGGFEGVVVRRNTGKTFKKKSLQDDEFQVIGGSVGKKHGILHLKGDKGSFSVQAPREIAENAPVGKKATVAYQRTTNTGLPHAPIFKGVRHDMSSKLKSILLDTTTRQQHEGEVERMQVATTEMQRRNALRLKAGLRPLTLQEVQADIEQSRARLLRGFGALNANDDQNQPSPFRDAAVGGLEGAAGYFITDGLAQKLAPAGSSILRKAGVAGGVGAAGTVLAGSLLNQIAKRRQLQQQQTTNAGFASRLPLLQLAQKLQSTINGAPLTSRVSHDKYVKDLRNQDIARRDEDIAHAGIAGGAAGALINKGKLAKLSPLKRAGVGALTGAAAVEGIRAITGRHRDIYGDRSAEGKAAEKLPAVGAATGAAVLGGIAARKLIKSKLHFGIIRSAVSEAIELSNRNQKLTHL